MTLAGEYASPVFAGTVGDYLSPNPDAEDRSEADRPSQGMERQIAFVDSSAFVALADAGDASHTAAVAAYRDLVATGYRLFTTDYMIAEAYDLLRLGPGPDVARQWLRSCAITRCHVEERDITQAKQRLLRHEESSSIGFSDAISLAVMDRLGVTDVFAVDQSILNAIP